MEINTENAFEIVLEEIAFITNEQIRIMKYNAEMEDRRLRLLEFIKRRENLRISKEAQTNLILNVSIMELKVLRTPEGFHNKDVEVADKKKCRYDNKGYCKYQKMCRFRHSGTICDQFLKDGKCEAGYSCQNRHPKGCKYWQGDTQGCKRGQLCRYLHDQSKERMEENCEEEGMGTISANQNEDVNPTEKLKELEEELVSKNATITKQKEVEAKLTAENEIMKRLVEKLKRVTTNMSKEIEHLKSTRS